jgi:bacteriocin biosynthesis cyclodehydratase domain-containing protein
MMQRRPRLAFPFTVLTQPDVVRLVAGEDHRYTLTGVGLDQWLPELLARLDGASRVTELLAPLTPERRGQAQQIIERLYGERVLVDGPAALAHRATACHVETTGQGALLGRLQDSSSRRACLPRAGAAPRLHLLCQTNLDYASALDASRRARAAGEPFLWASHGALDRAYVSPLFLPDAGPCFVCLLRSFQRLSPAPEIYDALIEHGRRDRPFAEVDLPADAVDVLHGLVQWKLSQTAVEQPPAALFRLHVLERASMEVTTHRVFVDPECPECRGGRR